MIQQREHVLIKNRGKPSHAELLLFDDFIFLDQTIDTNQPWLQEKEPGAGYLTKSGQWVEMSDGEWEELQKRSTKYREQMDLHLLSEMGIVKKLSKTDWVHCLKTLQHDGTLTKEYRKEIINLMSQQGALKKKFAQELSVEKQIRLMEEIAKYEDRKANLEMRVWSIYEENEGRIAIPNIDYYYTLPDQISSYHQVVSISLENVPIPSGVPIKELLDFKEDSETRSKIERFRWWMKKISKESMPKREIEDLIAENLFEFEDYIRKQKIRTNKTTIRSIFTVAAEVADNLFRAKFKQLVDTCYQFEDRKMALLEAEDKAPGREVAFLALVDDNWSTRRTG